MYLFLFAIEYFWHACFFLSSQGFLYNFQYLLCALFVRPTDTKSFFMIWRIKLHNIQIFQIHLKIGKIILTPQIYLTCICEHPNKQFPK